MLSFLVGMVSGLSYVNSFTLLFRSNKIPLDKKEICITICALAYSLSVIASSVFGYLFDVLTNDE